MLGKIDSSVNPDSYLILPLLNWYSWSSYFGICRYAYRLYLILLLLFPQNRFDRNISSVIIKILYQLDQSLKIYNNLIKIYKNFWTKSIYNMKECILIIKFYWILGLIRWNNAEIKWKFLILIMFCLIFSKNIELK